MRPVFKCAEQAFAGPGPCALGRPLRNLFGTEWSSGLYSGCCRLFVPDDLTAFMTHHVAAPFAMSSCLSPCLSPWQRSVRLKVGSADLTCARSVVR
ncbi:hypothetical protein BHE74_00027548 [Ensete ventricosum]|nr:hypothetical protein BHE74_00027548 [Ensete ventricosum]